MSALVNGSQWLPNTASLGEAREYVQALAMGKGGRCPCCGQRAQVYRRSINSGMAHSLVTMYAKAKLDWINVPLDVGARSREEGKLRYWGLVAEDTDKRLDGGHSGWWRVTELGGRFVREQATVPKYALVYDGVPLGLTGPEVGITDCLGEKFDLRELLNRE